LRDRRNFWRHSSRRPETLQRLNRSPEKLDDEQIAYLADVAVDLAEDNPDEAFTEEDVASIELRTDFTAKGLSSDSFHRQWADCSVVMGF
jgi:hypothetical protein